MIIEEIAVLRIMNMEDSSLVTITFICWKKGCYIYLRVEPYKKKMGNIYNASSTRRISKVLDGFWRIFKIKVILK